LFSIQTKNYVIQGAGYWLKMSSPGDKLACNPTEREKAEELTHLSSKIAKPVTIKS
jgi:hypothetical protein